MSADVTLSRWHGPDFTV